MTSSSSSLSEEEDDDEEEGDDDQKASSNDEETMKLIYKLEKNLKKINSKGQGHFSLGLSMSVLVHNFYKKRQIKIDCYSCGEKDSMNKKQKDKLSKENTEKKACKTYNKNQKEK